MLKRTSPLKASAKGRSAARTKSPLRLGAIAVLALTGAVWLGLSKPAPLPIVISTEAASIAAGAQHFARHCAVCHGPGAEGENKAQPRGGIKSGGGYWAPALNGSGHGWHHDPATLFKIIKEGSPAPDSTMRALGGKLSDAEILEVLAHLYSLWPQRIKQQYRQAFPAAITQ